MAKRSGLFGSGGNVTLMLAGLVGGVILDMTYRSLGLPGYNSPLRGCDVLSLGDAIQIGATGALTVVGFLTQSKALPAFTFGLLFGGLIPKVILPSMSLPRYGIFDFNPQTGAIVPIGRLS